MSSSGAPLHLLIVVVRYAAGVLPADNRVPWRGDSGLSDYLANGTAGISLVCSPISLPARV